MAFFDLVWYINYGNGSTTGYYSVPVWPGAVQSVTAGTWCRQSATPTVGNERCFVCVVAGTTGAAEPVWVVTRGANSAANIDGTVKWMECTGMSGPCGDLTNAPTWVASRVITLGEVYYDSVSGSLQAATTGGTSKTGAAPSFSATAGVTTTDNTVTWTSLGPTSNYTTAFKYPHARTANSFAANWGAAGNRFALSDTSTETQAAVITLTPPGTLAAPCSIYCISSTTTLASPTLSSGGSITTTAANNLNSNAASNPAYWNGVTFSCGTTGGTLALGAVATIYENCTFILGSSASGAISFAGGEYINCNFSFSSVGQGFTQGGGGVNGASLFVGTNFAVNLLPTTLFSIASYCTIRDCDLSAFGSGKTLASAGLSNGDTPGQVHFENCKLGASVTVGGTIGTSPLCFVASYNCDSANTNYVTSIKKYVGSILNETTIVRTGSSATDGTTPVSWNFTTTANSSLLQPLAADDLGNTELAIWNDVTGSLVTVTIYLISNTTLNNNDFWADVEALTTSGFPLGTITSSKMAVLGTPAALTSDTSTWGGSTNKYKIVLTCTPQNKGPIKVRLYAAKASQTTYVDPYIYLS